MAHRDSSVAAWSRCYDVSDVDPRRFFITVEGDTFTLPQHPELTTIWGTVDTSATHVRLAAWTISRARAGSSTRSTRSAMSSATLDGDQARAGEQHRRRDRRRRPLPGEVRRCELYGQSSRSPCSPCSSSRWRGSAERRNDNPPGRARPTTGVARTFRLWHDEWACVGGKLLAKI